MSLNQVRVGDPLQQPQQPPTPPRRSSSFIPMQRWRASELLPHSYTTHMQKPVETNPRYAYNFSQSQRHGSYIEGFIPRQYCDDEQNNVYTAAVCYDAVFSPHGQNLSGYKRPTAGNINRESCRYGSTERRAPASMQDHAILQNMHREAFHDAQGNTCVQRLGHTRSHTLDSIHTRDGYTENIRAMAGQMYGDPPSHRRTPTQTDVNRNTHMAADGYAHSHNHALTRHHHLRLSGGLWQSISACVWNMLLYCVNLCMIIRWNVIFFSLCKYRNFLKTSICLIYSLIQCYTSSWTMTLVCMTSFLPHLFLLFCNFRFRPPGLWTPILLFGVLSMCIKCYITSPLFWAFFLSHLFVSLLL